MNTPKQIPCDEGDMVLIVYQGRQEVGTICRWSHSTSQLTVEYDDSSDGAPSLVFLDDKELTITCNLGNYNHVIASRAIEKLIKI